jgi:hypothetical protein
MPSKTFMGLQLGKKRVLGALTVKPREFMLPISDFRKHLTQEILGRISATRANFAKSKRVAGAAIFVSLVSHSAFGQTTRTNPSAASTSPTIQSSSATGPNTPCGAFNSTSSCYAARIPRNPCYSAVSPDSPCSTTTTPRPQSSPTPLPSAAATAPQTFVRAFTKDQAKAQIEAAGYSKVSRLRRDDRGAWQGTAEKDGSVINVILDSRGNLTTE